MVQGAGLVSFALPPFQGPMHFLSLPSRGSHPGYAPPPFQGEELTRKLRRMRTRKAEVGV